jgi:hypothetical protein
MLFFCIKERSGTIKAIEKKSIKLENIIDKNKSITLILNLYDRAFKTFKNNTIFFKFF